MATLTRPTEEFCEKTTSYDSNNFELIGTLLQSSLDHDWASIVITNKFVLSALQEDRSVSTDSHEAQTVEVARGIVYTTRSKGTFGILSENTTYMRLPGSNTFQKMYYIILEAALSLGDCGAVVLDVGTQEWYGHIVASSENRRIAFVMPASGIVKSSSTTWGSRAINQSGPMASAVGQINLTMPDARLPTAFRQSVPAFSSNVVSARMRSPTTAPHMHEATINSSPTPDMRRMSSSSMQPQSSQATHSESGTSTPSLVPTGSPRVSETTTSETPHIAPTQDNHLMHYQQSQFPASQPTPFSSVVSRLSDDYQPVHQSFQYRRQRRSTPIFYQASPLPVYHQLPSYLERLQYLTYPSLPPESWGLPWPWNKQDLLHE
jgi:hypothetical protein